jgi:tetratricopeptide (TPR) repeat protein
MKIGFAALVFALTNAALVALTGATTEIDQGAELNEEALRLEAAGEYAQAIPLAEQALLLTEQALGPEHPEVAVRLNNLGVLYKNIGRYAEAELLLKRAITVLEKALGAEHPELAGRLVELAEVFFKSGKFVEAEPLLLRALQIFEKAASREAADTGMVLNDLIVLSTCCREKPQPSGRAGRCSARLAC